MSKYPIRLIIAGGRDFDNFRILDEAMNRFECISAEDIIILSGKARGADTLGERYAEMYGIKIEGYPANWTRYGKSAGYKRNEQMAENATHLLAFWDKMSRGTKHMIDLAHRYELNVEVVNY